MLDSILRPIKDHLLSPLTRTPIGRLPPLAISAFGLGASISAAIAAWQLRPALAVALWLVGRVADGLDGAVARSTDRSSDAGGLLDFVFDSIGYAAIPIGLAFGIDDRGTWIATAVLLATFYVNSVALGYVSALLEKRSPDTETLDRATSAIHPRGLVEGAETIVFFAIALAFNNIAATVWWVMATAVLLTAIERVRWALNTLQ
ncbi:MAG: CDP-alcohol phosphatidyltransferase family protein [Ilumatobacter sp.]|nr:CDP-alcohol phosphatidyltransferase family protein [Ilumatobacter sp.]